MLTNHEITDAETSLHRKNVTVARPGVDRIKRRALERWENEGGCLDCRGPVA